MSSSPRIAHVLSNLTTGGAEINTLRLVDVLAQRGISQIVVSLTEEVDPDLVHGLAVPVISLAKRRGLIETVRFLTKVIRTEGVDLVHGRAYVTWKECVAAKLLARRRFRLVQSFHGPATFSLHRVARGATAILARDITDGFIAVSQDLASRLIDQWSVSSDKVRVIPNGVDVRRFAPPGDRRVAKTKLGLNAEDFVVGTVGSLLKVKNHQLLIKAFAKFRQQVHNSVLLIVGDGPLRMPLHELARSLHINDRVRFCGCQYEVAGYLHAMDVFVQPSFQEGSPTAVLEAMSCGLPTLATACAGAKELNKSKGLPLLVDAQQEDAVADLLLELVGDPQRCAELGRFARQTVTDGYDFERTADAYVRFYEEVCSSSTETRVGAGVSSAPSATEESCATSK